MQLYSEFCDEVLDEAGVLQDFSLHYPDNYNFGYDVVDEMARLAPQQRAMVWCNPKGEHREFTFQDISRLSNQAAQVLRAHGVKKGDKVLVILKRNYEYWYVAPALHKLGAVLIPATHMLTVDDLTCRIQTAPETLERTDTKAADPMLIYFTSGTTGYPQGGHPRSHLYALPYRHRPPLAKRAGKRPASDRGGDRLGQGVLGQDPPCRTAGGLRMRAALDNGRKGAFGC